MNEIGRYRYVVLTQEKRKMFREIGKKAAQKNPNAIGIFVAGGKAVDKKVNIANKYISENLNKQITAKKKFSVIDFIKQMFR